MVSVNPVMDGGRPLSSGGRVARSENNRLDGLTLPPRSAATPISPLNHSARGLSGSEPERETSISNKQSLRGRVAAWFASLELSERSRLLTFDDPSWCQLAANMAARLDRRAFRGQEIRFEVQPPACAGARATFQATALEADHTADSGTSPPVVLSRAAAEIVERSALAHGNPPTAVTFSEEFIQDTEAFFRVMDAVSLGRFLSDPDALFADIGNKTASVLAGSFSRKRVSGAAFSAAPSGARWNGFTKGFDRGVISGDRGMKGPASGLSHGMEEWVQCPWLVGMGGFGLAAFLANRVEVRLRLAIPQAAPAVFHPSTSGIPVSRRGKGSTMGAGGRRKGTGASQPSSAGLVEAKSSLEAFFSSLSGEEKLLALSQCATGSLTTLLREGRDNVEMSMYKSGFLGGRPPGGLAPRNRYEDMDWVRGRPPDALLFLKALVKAAAAPNDLSLSISSGNPTHEALLLPLPQRGSSFGGASTAVGNDNGDVTTATNIESGGVGVRAGTRLGVGSARDVDVDPLRRKSGHQRQPEALDITTGGDDHPLPSAARSRFSRTAGSVGGSVGGDGKRLGGVSSTGDARQATVVWRRLKMDGIDVLIPPRMLGLTAGVSVPSRALAESALLSPLREVGTVAGVLREGIGRGLREMVAARAAKDLTDLLLQESTSSSATRKGVVERGGSSGAKARGKKKRLKKKRQQGGSAGGGGGGGMSGSLDGAVLSHRAPEREQDPVHGGGSVARADSEHAAEGGQCSTDSSAESVASGGTEKGKGQGLEACFKKGYEGGETTTRSAGGLFGEGEGDESLDDEEEQRGVVKKLRRRTEMGWMGASAIPSGGAPITGGGGSSGRSGGGSGGIRCGGGDDGFVSPMDLRRRGKARALAHSVVLDVAEVVLRRCVPDTKPPALAKTAGIKRTAETALSRAVNSVKTFAVSKKIPTTVKTSAATKKVPMSATKTPSAAVTTPSMAKTSAATVTETFMRAGALSPTMTKKEAPLSSTRQWLSPGEPRPHPFWKIPAAAAPAAVAGVPGERGSTKAVIISRAQQPPTSPVLGSAFAAPSSAVKVGGEEDEVRPPSLPRSPKHSPGAVLLRRRGAREGKGARKDLFASVNVNDADERMSWSSFDSLDVRVDDQDVADITDLPYRQRGPPRVPSATAAASGSSSMPKRSASIYFPSPASPGPSSPRPAPVAPVPTTIASFHNHGMALDWRTRTVAATAVAKRVGGSAAVELTGESAGSMDGGESRVGGSSSDGFDGSIRVSAGPRGFFVPHVGMDVGSGSSFFGGQGLFSWMPSLDGKFPTDVVSDAWGSGGNSSDIGGCGDSVDRQPWHGCAPKLEVATGVGDSSVAERGEGKEGIDPADVCGNGSGGEREHKHELEKEIVLREQADEPRDAPVGDGGAEESRQEGGIPNRESAEPVQPVDSSGSLVEPAARHPPANDTESSADAPPEPLHESKDNTSALDTVVLVCDAAGDHDAADAGAEGADEGRLSASLNDCEGRALPGDRDTGGQPPAPAVGNVCSDMPQVLDPPPIGDARDPMVRGEFSVAAAADTGVAASAAAAETTGDEVSVSPSGEADISTQHPVKPRIGSGTGSWGVKCCLCSCHDSNSAARPPPTPPPARSRASRRQRRRASAPEKQTHALSKQNVVGTSGVKGPCGDNYEGSDGGGGNGGGGREEGNDRGRSGGGSSVGHKPPQATPTRKLSEEARKPTVLCQQPAASFNSTLFTPGMTRAGTGAGGTAASSAATSEATSPSPAATAVEARGTSLERGPARNGIGSPPRSERQLRPRSWGRSGNGGGSGGNGSANGSVNGSVGSAGRGRNRLGGSQSTPTSYQMCRARRRKSESGLGVEAAAAAALGLGRGAVPTTSWFGGESNSSGPGGGMATLRTRRSVSAANASNMAIGMDPGTPPPFLNWSAYSENGAGGQTWSRGKSDSEGGVASGVGRSSSARPPPGEDQGPAESSAVEDWNGGSGGGGGGGSVGEARGRSAQEHPRWAGGRGGQHQGKATIYRSRGGSWESDPRDGFEFRVDRGLKGGRTGARSARRRVATRRGIASGTRSVSEAAARRSYDSVRAGPATTTAVEWSSDEGCSVAGTVDRTGEDEPEDWLHVYLGDDKSVGLPKSVGDGFDGSFASDAGGCEIGDVSSLNTPCSQATGNGNGGGRYQDFGGARFQEAVLARSRGSASRGETRRAPSSGLDVEAEADVPFSEEDGEEGSRHHAHRGGVGGGMGGGDGGDGHRRDAHTAEVEEDNLLMRDMCLRLEAEVAKLRNLLAAAHGTGPLPGDVPPPLSAAGAGGAGAASGAGNPIGGRGSFLSGFAEGGGGGGGGGGGRGLPRMSHMVIPEHRTAAWEVMSDDGQGLVMWQRQAPFAPSWTAGSDGGGGGGRGRGGREGGGYNGFRPTAPVFVPGQFAPGGSSTAAANAGAGGPILAHAGQQQGSLSLPRALRSSPSPPPLGGAAWSQGVGVAGGALGGELGGVGVAGPGGGGGGGGGGSGTIPWDDDYRALRARLEVPSLGFGSLRTQGCSRRGKGGAPHGGDSLRSRLCEDLSRFLHIVTERERRTFDAKWVAYQRCRAVVRGLWPRAQVKPYGSFVTGLSLPWSDLDLVICLPKVRRDAPADTPGALEGRNAIKETWQQELARSLGGERWVDNNSLKIISHTAVPVIKLTTVGYAPSSAPSTAFAAATAAAAAATAAAAAAAAATAASTPTVATNASTSASNASSMSATAAAAPSSTSVATRSVGATATDGSVGRTSSSSAPIGEGSPGLGQSASMKASDDDGVGCGSAGETRAAGKEEQEKRKNGPRDEVAASAASSTSTPAAAVSAASATATVVAKEGQREEVEEERKPEGQGNGELIPSAEVSPMPDTLPLPPPTPPAPAPPHPAREAKEAETKDMVLQDLRNGATSRGVIIDRNLNRSQEHGHHGQGHGQDHEGVRAAGLVGGGVTGGVGGASGGGAVAGAGIVDPVGLPRVLVDVSFEGQGHNGQAANQLVKDLVDGFPALRPLALLLKQFMMEKGLCVSYTGGLSSYALTLMVARYLQEQTSQMDSGSLLLGFLDFYGNHFDPRRTGISVRRRRYFSRSAPLPPPPAGPPPPVPPVPGAPTAHRVFYGQRGRPPSFRGGLEGTAPPGPPPVAGIPGWSDMTRMPYRFDPLFIEDPMNLSNNVGRNCFRIYQIQRAWSDAHASLTRALDDESQLRSSPYRLLRCIISDPEPAPDT